MARKLLSSLIHSYDYRIRWIGGRSISVFPLGTPLRADPLLALNLKIYGSLLAPDYMPHLGGGLGSWRGTAAPVKLMPGSVQRAFLPLASRADLEPQP
jgi:hypothetical protein